MMSRRYLRRGPAGADVAVALQSARPLVEPDLSGDLLRTRRRVLRRSVRRGKPARRLLSCISVALVVLVLWQWGNAGWILIKAQLAQWLIAQAWEQGQQTAGNAEAIKPWPWADTHPVARLRMPEQGVDLFVLEGAQGNSLAFGPGHLQGTALPGDGISVIGGHRDTHFRFLRNLHPGDNLHLETRTGRRLTYRIDQRQVVDSRHTPLLLPDYPATGLVLVTCYPFDALDPNGPLRLVVWAREIDGDLLDLAEVPLDMRDSHPLSFSL